MHPDEETAQLDTYRYPNLTAQGPADVNEHLRDFVKFQLRHLKQFVVVTQGICEETCKLSDSRIELSVTFAF